MADTPPPSRSDAPPPASDLEIERERLSFDLQARRVEARSRVLQAIFGTMIVGVAAAAFPFAQKFAELTFQERIEEARHRAEQTALETRLKLEEALAVTQARLDEAAQDTATQRERREFLNSLAAEARSEDIEKRIVLAEFFTHLAHDEEVDKWSAFLEYLKEQQTRFNEERVALNEIIRDPDAARADRDQALNRLQQIDRLESPESKTPAASAWPGCDTPDPVIEPVSFRVENGLLVAADGAPVPFRETPNKSGLLTGGAPKYVVLHYTAGGSVGAAVNHFAASRTRASAHIVIGRSGQVFQMGRFDEKLWHAGRSNWDGLVGLNSHSVGIELANWGRLSRDGGDAKTWNGDVIEPDRACSAEHRNHPGVVDLWERFAPAQLDAAAGVAKALVDAFGLSPEDVIGNDDVSPQRKRDPGPALPMAQLRDALSN